MRFRFINNGDGIATFTVRYFGLESSKCCFNLLMPKEESLFFLLKLSVLYHQVVVNAI